MIFDNENQKQQILDLVKDEELKKEIEKAKIIAPWIPEHPNNNFVKQDD